MSRLGLPFRAPDVFLSFFWGGQGTRNANIKALHTGVPSGKGRHSKRSFVWLGTQTDGIFTKTMFLPPDIQKYKTFTKVNTSVWNVAVVSQHASSSPPDEQWGVNLTTSFDDWGSRGSNGGSGVKQSVKE